MRRVDYAHPEFALKSAKSGCGFCAPYMAFVTAAAKSEHFMFALAVKNTVQCFATAG